MSRVPESPGSPQPKLTPQKKNPLVWGPLTVLCPWAPGGRATPVITSNVNTDARYEIEKEENKWRTVISINKLYAVKVHLVFIM